MLLVSWHQLFKRCSYRLNWYACVNIHYPGVPPLGLEAAEVASVSRTGSGSNTPLLGATPRSSLDFSSSNWQQQQQPQQPWLNRVLSKQVRVGMLL